MKKQVFMALACAVVLSNAGSAKAVDGTTLFPPLDLPRPYPTDAQLHYSREGYQSVMNTYDAEMINGYIHLLTATGGRIPRPSSGLGIAQVEGWQLQDRSFIQDLRYIYANHGPQPQTDHALIVARLFSGGASYNWSMSPYLSFSPGLDHVHSWNFEDFMLKFLNNGVPQSTSGPVYPSVDSSGGAISAPQLLNASIGLGDTVEQIRALDFLIKKYHIVACTSQPGSYTTTNNSTSGNSYNAIVVGQRFINANYKGGTTLDNVTGVRPKPDIVAWDELGASSYASPMVCSAAALLVERAKMDTSFRKPARPSEVIKAILMAGATRHNFRVSTPWSNFSLSKNDVLLEKTDWRRESASVPLDRRYGAGVLNVNTSYSIMEAGLKKSTLTDVGTVGWDYEKITQKTPSTYWFDVTTTRSMRYSALMTWHRDVYVGPKGTYQSRLAQICFPLYRSKDPGIHFLVVS